MIVRSGPWGFCSPAAQLKGQGPGSRSCGRNGFVFVPCPSGHLLFLILSNLNSMAALQVSCDDASCITVFARQESLFHSFPRSWSPATAWAREGRDPSFPYLPTSPQSPPPESTRRQALELCRDRRPHGFAEVIKSFQVGFEPLPDFPPADFHRRRQAVVLDRE